VGLQVGHAASMIASYDAVVARRRGAAGCCLLPVGGAGRSTLAVGPDRGAGAQLSGAAAAAALSGAPVPALPAPPARWGARARRVVGSSQLFPFSRARAQGSLGQCAAAAACSGGPSIAGSPLPSPHRRSNLQRGPVDPANRAPTYTGEQPAGGAPARHPACARPTAETPPHCCRPPTPPNKRYRYTTASRTHAHTACTRSFSAHARGLGPPPARARRREGGRRPAMVLPLPGATRRRKRCKGEPCRGPSARPAAPYCDARASHSPSLHANATVPLVLPRNSMACRLAAIVYIKHSPSKHSRCLLLQCPPASQSVPRQRGAAGSPSAEPSRAQARVAGPPAGAPQRPSRGGPSQGPLRGCPGGARPADQSSPQHNPKTWARGPERRRPACMPPHAGAPLGARPRAGPPGRARAPTSGNNDGRRGREEGTR
jgi:hypothetical protein